MVGHENELNTTAPRNVYTYTKIHSHIGYKSLIHICNHIRVSGTVITLPLCNGCPDGGGGCKTILFTIFYHILPFLAIFNLMTMFNPSIYRLQ